MFSPPICHRPPELVAGEEDLATISCGSRTPIVKSRKMGFDPQLRSESSDDRLHEESRQALGRPPRDVVPDLCRPDPQRKSSREPIQAVEKPDRTTDSEALRRRRFWDHAAEGRCPRPPSPGSAL